MAAEVFGEIEAAFARHHQIQDNDVEAKRLHLFPGVGGISGGDDHEIMVA